MRQRQIFVWDDWSKGANSRDKLLGVGVSREIRNFECRRKGVLEKIRGYLQHGTTVPFWNESTKPCPLLYCYDFTIFYGNSNTYLVMVGIDSSAKAIISVWDGTDWTSWKEADGYFHNTLNGAVFVASSVGGRPVLRIFPRYPSSTSLNEWIPMMLLETEQIKTYETWPLTRQTTRNASPVYYGQAVSYWNSAPSGPELHCSCKRGVTYLKPCVSKNDATRPSIATCPYVSERVDFSNSVFYDSKVVGISKALIDIIGLTSYPRVLLSKFQVVDIITGVVLKVPDLSSYGIIEASNYPRELWHTDGDYSTNEGSHIDAGIRLIRGIQTPLVINPRDEEDVLYEREDVIESNSMDSNASPEDEGNLPSEIEAKYTGEELVQFGYSYVMIDGTHSQIVEKYDRIQAGHEYFVFWGPPMWVPLPSPPATAESLAMTDLRSMVKGLNIWRKAPSDPDWMLLRYVPIHYDSASSPMESNKVFYDLNGMILESHVLTNGIVFVSELKDLGGILANDIFTATGGLAKDDMGIVLAAKSACAYGRKIFCGNMSRLKPWDSSYTSLWEDDKVGFTLYDNALNQNIDDYLLVAEGELDQIVRIEFFGRQMGVFENNRVFILDVLGTSEGSWRQSKEIMGGVKYRNQVCSTPYGLVWLSEAACRIWTGEEVISLSEAFEDDYKTLYETDSDTLIVGFDRYTDKLYITNDSGDKAFVIYMKTGAFTTIESTKEAQFNYLRFVNLTDGRLVGLRPALAGVQLPFFDFIEITASQATANPTIGIGTGIWKSGEVDLFNLAAEGRLMKLMFYVTYKRQEHVSAATFTIKWKMDNASQVTLNYTLADTTSETTALIEVPIGVQGRVLSLEFHTNEGTYPLAYIRLWKISGLVEMAHQI